MTDPILQLCQPGDLCVDRHEVAGTPVTVLTDCDGERLFTFWGQHLTDEQAQTALQFANEAFRRGAAFGRLSVQHEVKKALGLAQE